MHGGDGLCVMRAGGGERRVLSKLGHRDAPPAWSPDSKRLAFTDLRPVGEDRVDFDVHVVAAEGGASRRIAVSAEAPAWSADGRRVFVIARRGKQTDIVAVDVASGEESKVTADDAVESELEPSPDRKRLAFVTGAGKKPELVVIDADGKNRRQLVALRGRPQAPTWSPDGKRLAFVSLPEGAAADRGDDLVLYTVDVERGTVTHVTREPADWPAWRPAG